MSTSPDVPLSRRERQIMDILYARGAASANDVVGDLPDPPGRTTVRTLLRILEQKGHLRHKQRGIEYVYLPTRSRARMARVALRRLLNTFFEGSLEKAVAMYLHDPSHPLTPEQRKRLADLVQEAEEKGDQA